MRRLLRSPTPQLRLLARRRALGLGLAAGSLVLLPGLASAHAVIVEASPKNGETVNGKALAVRLRFNSRIDHKRSRLTLIAPDRKEINIPVAADSPAEVIAGQATLKQSGAFRMRWQVLALDGHITRGDINFTVVGVA